MDEIEKRYETLSKESLRFLGLWPTQEKSKRYKGFALVAFFMIKLTIPQFLCIIVNPDDKFIFFENTMILTFYIMVSSKHGAAMVNFSKVKALMLSIDELKKPFTDPHELELMKKYEGQGFLLARIYAIIMLITVLVYNMVPFVPPFLDVIYPLKSGPRPIILPYRGEFIWFKQEDYHYYVSFVAIFDVLIFLPVFVGIESVYTTTVREICGLFEIVCIRFQRQFSRAEGSPTSEISDAVKLYNECVRCVQFLEGTYSITIFTTQITSLLIFSLCAIYILYVNNDVFNGLRFSTFGIAILIHMGYYFGIGQLLINSSDKVHFSIYSSNWFLASAKLQRLLVMASTRTLYPCFITSGKLNPLNLESFGTILKRIASTISVMLAVL
ncbi:odorant receptor 2a-like [Trichogramma pretiosum]|uniref:odorant receptor 2a-like n=1 Tax=Trichogramma pretiosum TaxID=7493 RepID=UPI000C71BDD9|nr:odorant receptor 2a-like [Trichogramma pretiosum]